VDMAVVSAAAIAIAAEAIAAAVRTAAAVTTVGAVATLAVATAGRIMEAATITPHATMAAASVWVSMLGPATATPRRPAIPPASMIKAAIGITIPLAPLRRTAINRHQQRKRAPRDGSPFLVLGKIAP
jgi:hypothetical protein